MGGETLDMPSGELRLLWIWERRGAEEGAGHASKTFIIKEKGGEKREGGGGKKEDR